MGFLLLGKSPRKMKWDWGAGMSPSEHNLPPSFLAYSAHKVGPQSRSPPPPRLMLGKIVSWHNGLEAKPNTRHIPRLCRWLALGAKSALSRQDPKCEKAPLADWKTELCASLGYLLGLICKCGPILFSRPQFPALYRERARMELGTLNCFPAVKAGSKVTGRNPRASIDK